MTSLICRQALAIGLGFIFLYPHLGAFAGPASSPRTLGEILAANGGKLPIPFEELLKSSGGTEDNVVLMPRGRSLVARENDYDSPRILLNPGSTTRETPTQLIIGYTPKTDALEISSWNPKTKSYDFIEVKNYSDPKKQAISRAPEGKCTECHTNNRLIFSTAPWAEVTDFDPFDPLSKRARKTPLKIAAAVAAKNKKEGKDPKKYYGIDLEKYKTAATDRVASFAGTIVSSEANRKSQDLCGKLCQSGNQASDEVCRRQVLKLSLWDAQRFNQPDPKRQTAALQVQGARIDAFDAVVKDPSILPKPPAPLNPDQLVTRVLFEEYSRFSAAKTQIRSNTSTIPDRDVETGDLYRAAQTDEEKAQIKAKLKAFNALLQAKAKENPTAALPEPDPKMFKIKLTPKEREAFRISDVLPAQSPVTSADFSGVISPGCVSFNAEQLEALKGLNLDAALAELEKPQGKLEALVKSFPPSPFDTVTAIAGMQGRKLALKTDMDHCQANVDAALAVLQPGSPMDAELMLGFYRLVGPKRQAGAFDIACSKCHNGDGLPLLPYKKAIETPETPLSTADAQLKERMIAKLTKCQMPPSDAQPQLPALVRTQMLKGLGSTAPVSCPNDTRYLLE